MNLRAGYFAGTGEGAATRGEAVALRAVDRVLTRQ
jgi:hypothetical protein